LGEGLPTLDWYIHAPRLKQCLTFVKRAFKVANMSKKFYLMLPSRRKVIITVDDDDAWRMRSENWRIRLNGNVYEVYRSNGGVTMMFGRTIMGIVKDDVCVSHKNNDCTDFRKENLKVFERNNFTYEVLHKLGDHAKGWPSGKCKRGHLMTPDNIMTNGKNPRVCKTCVSERKKRIYREKHPRLDNAA
jgi:hypothetical protein